ncbi:ribosome biogenesis factor YjgA [Propionivibrio sp.]|uniref:ribosome biogenesis factor YjgA n=1 Tax=Propionivibrio sp. TaxID=2212460 RepID=UPI003BF2A934
MITHEEEEPVPLSKTRRKQAMEELQALGEELVALSKDRIKKIDISEELREAVVEAQRMMRPDEAKRRQMQYIGKIMRNVEVEPIRAALALVRGDSASETAKLHRLERLRTELLADEKVLHEIATLYPSVDLQHLRSLRRAALKEHELNKPPRSYRAIYQLLKELEQDANNETEDSEPTSNGE